MRILIDTNVVVRLSETGTRLCLQAQEAVSLLPDKGFEGCLVPQVIYEYWSVATRPSELNGLGLSTAETERDVNDLLAAFTFLRDERAVYERWFDLVRLYQVQGKNVHDARLVAAMERHQLQHVLTFNEHDFHRYARLSVLSPAALIAMQP